MIISVVISLASKFPVIALMFSEGWEGQYDMAITTGAQTHKNGINATKIGEILNQLGDNFNRFSPRIHIRVEVVRKNGGKGGASIMVLDTLKEKQLQIGRNWIYTEQIPKGAAIITQHLANSQN
ncbi:MAG: hypothetical protein EZS28_026208, partial [Streblomastix strix]